MYTDKCTNKNNNSAWTISTWNKLLGAYPNFKRFGEDFKKENAAWLQKRPAREI